MAAQALQQVEAPHLGEAVEAPEAQAAGSLEAIGAPAVEAFAEAPDGCVEAAAPAGGPLVAPEAPVEAAPDASAGRPLVAPEAPAAVEAVAEAPAAPAGWPLVAPEAPAAVEAAAEAPDAAAVGSLVDAGADPVPAGAGVGLACQGNEFVGRRLNKVIPGRFKRNADGTVNQPSSYGGVVTEMDSFDEFVHVVFDDGASEHMSLIELKVWLVQPPEFQPPCKRSRGG